MSEYARQQQRYARRHHDSQDEAAGRDLRDAALDEEVACCLDEIDEVLSQEAAEREQAEREFEAFGRHTPERELRRWQAKYAHLGLKYGRSCCGTPFFYDEKVGG